LACNGHVHPQESGSFRYTASQGHLEGRGGLIEVIIHFDAWRVDRIQITGKAVLSDCRMFHE
jgi:predicted PhzF superfamily epimerase YddE/YHI9